MDDWRRWMMLFLYSFLQWFGGTIWISYASISLTASEYYNTSMEVINFFALIFLFVQLPMAPLSSYLLSKSYYWTMMLAYLISALGVWIKVIAQNNLGAALFGQFLIGCMNSVTLGACSTLTAIWFKPSEQSLAVSISSISNLVGAGCGLILSPYISDIGTLLYIHASYTSFATILNVIFSRKKKPNDYSEISIKFCKELGLLLTDWYLLGLIFFISLAIAVVHGLSGVLFEVLQPFGLTESDSGWIGLSLYIGAIIGGFLTSFLVSKSKNLIWPVRVIALVSMIGIILWAGLASYFWGNILGAIISGIGLFGFLPLGIEVAVEQNKKIEESISTNLIFLVIQIISIGYTYPFIYFHEWLQVSGMWLAVSFTLLAFFAILLMYHSKFVQKYKQVRDSPNEKTNDIRIISQKENNENEEGDEEEGEGDEVNDAESEYILNLDNS